MILGERIKRNIMYKCDECGIEKMGNYQDITKKNIHLCRTCSNVKSNKEFVESKMFMPSMETQDIIISRGDGLPNDNLEIIPRLDNQKKKSRCSITKEELFSKVFSEGDNRVAELNYGT